MYYFHIVPNSIPDTLFHQLQTANNATAAQTELVASLQAQIEGLQAEVAVAKENLDVLRSSTSEASLAAASAAAVEHETLLKAQADLHAIQAELEKVNSENAQALQEAQERIQSLEAEASRVAELDAAVEQLKTENEEQATKVSELEIEILETREEQEEANDELTKTLARVKALEDDLVKANVSLTTAAKLAQAKEAEFSSTAEATANAHSDELAKAAAESLKLLDQLAATQAELENAVAANEQAKADFETAAKEYAAKLEEAENLQRFKEAELSEEIQRITTELEVRIDLSRGFPNSILFFAPSYRARKLSTMSRLKRSRQSTKRSYRRHLSALRLGFPTLGFYLSDT